MFYLSIFRDSVTKKLNINIKYIIKRFTTKKKIINNMYILTCIEYKTNSSNHMHFCVIEYFFKDIQIFSLKIKLLKKINNLKTKPFGACNWQNQIFDIKVM